MVCPYKGFSSCDWERCAARMYVKDPTSIYTYMKVCAIAYNGGTLNLPGAAREKDGSSK